MNRADGAIANLTSLLRPVQPILDDPALTNFHINGPGHAFVHRRGRGKERIELPYTVDDLEDIAINAACLNRGDDVDDTAPFAGGVLPGQHRVQIARPPATADGVVALSIRKPDPVTPTISGLKAGGLFDGTVGRGMPSRGRRRPELAELYQSGDQAAFLDRAMALGLNVIIAGPQDVGKTHLMRAATTSIPVDTRVLTVEDLSEAINLRQPDVLNLYYSKGGQGSSRHTADHCIEAAVRMASKVLLIQELRDGSAFSALSALLAGIQVLSTAHSNSAEETYDRLRSMVKMHPMGMHRDDKDVLADLYATVDVIAYCIKNERGEYRVEQVFYDPGLQAKHAEANRDRWIEEAKS